MAVPHNALPQPIQPIVTADERARTRHAHGRFALLHPRQKSLLDHSILPMNLLQATPFYPLMVTGEKKPDTCEGSSYPQAFANHQIANDNIETILLMNGIFALFVCTPQDKSLFIITLHFNILLLAWLLSPKGSPTSPNTSALCTIPKEVVLRLFVVGCIFFVLFLLLKNNYDSTCTPKSLGGEHLIIST